MNGNTIYQQNEEFSLRKRVQPSQMKLQRHKNRYQLQECILKLNMVKQNNESSEIIKSKFTVYKQLTA
jgi:ribosomal protein L35AE/L33A